MSAAAAGVEMEEGFTEAELQVAAILRDLKSILRARDRRRRRRRPEIPSWGARRPRSVPEWKPAGTAPGPAAERDGAASPDTPLAYPESGGDDAPADDDEEDEDARKAAAQDQWVQEQHGVVASLSQENAHLLKVRRQQEQEQQQQQARVLDLNEPAPARAADEDERARAQAAAAAAAAAEWFRQAQLQAALQKAAVTAGARRRRLEILRAKTACPLVSSRPRRAGRG
ncbi:hypothetical protein BS78_04G016300 [Paspalum vaginatum]|nr:hypothetical protein BS78_04G016300 [Paspalum vaginatum]